MFLTAFFTRIWKRLHDDRPDGLKIEPPLKVKKTNDNKSFTETHNASNDTTTDTFTIDGSSSDELKRFRDNITRITGNMNMNGGNMMTSMMTGGCKLYLVSVLVLSFYVFCQLVAYMNSSPFANQVMNPAILDAMCGGSGGRGGNQSMMGMPRLAEGNDGKTAGEGDQQRHAEV
jgi:hypothetical protein